MSVSEDESEDQRVHYNTENSCESGTQTDSKALVDADTQCSPTMTRQIAIQTLAQRKPRKRIPGQYPVLPLRMISKTKGRQDSIDTYTDAEKHPSKTANKPIKSGFQLHVNTGRETEPTDQLIHDSSDSNTATGDEKSDTDDYASNDESNNKTYFFLLLRMFTKNNKKQ